MSEPENSGRGALAGEILVQALELRDIRNNIVHGVLSANADPRRRPASITCLVGGH